MLVATDATDSAAPAMRVAAELARLREMRPQLLGVCPRRLPADANYLRTRAVDAARLAREVRGQLAACVGVDATWPVDIVVGSPSAEIGRLAASPSVDLVVMGLRPHATPERVSRDETVLLVTRGAVTPILAVTSAATSLPTRIVVGIDFSRASINAAHIALDLVAEGGELVLVHVQPEIPPADREHANASEIYARGVGGAFRRLIGELSIPEGVTVRGLIVRGDPVSALLACAEAEGASLIALGAQRHTSTRALTLGAVTTALVRDARFSLLVAPPLLRGAWRTVREGTARPALAQSAEAGSEKENVLPSPTVLSTQMRPSCASTIPLAIARP